jgi:hypothetical protein
MIADLDETLRQLLIAELPIKNSDIDVKFEQPRREWSARLTRPTINFYLYDVRENQTLRQHQWQRMDNGNGRLAQLKRTPLRVDCHYMITVWAAQPEDEHRLLTRTLLALFRFPELPPHRFVGQMVGQPFEVQTQLARTDRLTNPSEIWSAMDNEIRPTTPYVVTLALDPWTEVTGPIVRTPIFHVGRAENQLPIHTQLEAEMGISSTAFIGGVVRDGETPQAGIEVAVKGTGFMATTDEHGRFTLGTLPLGHYTLIAWPPKGKPKQQEITIPQETYDIEL